MDPASRLQFVTELWQGPQSQEKVQDLHRQTCQWGTGPWVRYLLNTNGPGIFPSGDCNFARGDYTIVEVAALLMVFI